MNRKTPPNLLFCAVGLLAVVASACGSSASAPTEPHRSNAAIGKDKVIAMVLTGNDLPGFALQSNGTETLKEQLTPAGTPQRALANRLVRANWIASAHSEVIGANGHIVLFTSANLFKTAAAAQHVSQLERTSIPADVHVRRMKTPVGAPAGAQIEYVRHGQKAVIEINWVQGAVVSFAVLGARPNETFTPLGERRIGALMATAANAQARRITDAEHGIPA